MIVPNSRYAVSTVVPATNLNGVDILTIVVAEPVDTTITFRNFVVSGEDTIESIAGQQYGDPTLWWVIANANPEQLDWSEITSGQVIRIPNLPGLVP